MRRAIGVALGLAFAAVSRHYRSGPERSPGSDSDSLSGRGEHPFLRSGSRKAAIERDTDAGALPLERDVPRRRVRGLALLRLHTPGPRGMGVREMRLMCALVVVSASLLSTVRTKDAASATPITWYVTGDYSAPAYAQGLFTYDPSTDAYTNVDIYYSTPAGDVNFVSGTGSAVELDTEPEELDGLGKIHLGFLFRSPLTNAGGVIPYQGTGVIPNKTQFINAGTVSATPEPSTVILIGAGLLGLAARRRSAAMK